MIFNHKYYDLIQVDPNQNDLIINWNYEYSKSVHVNPNQTGSNQPITADYTNIGSIHHSANIHSTENILTSPVHYPVPSSQIFCMVEQGTLLRHHLMTHHHKA